MAKDPRVWNMWVDSRNCEPSDYIWGYYSDLVTSYKIDDPNTPESHRATYWGYIRDGIAKSGDGHCKAGTKGSAQRISGVAVSIPATSPAVSALPTQASFAASSAAPGGFALGGFNVTAPVLLAGLGLAYFFFFRRR